ncbi:MAG: PIN domain-containing protein [Clostridiales bacterium]|nr:PIN domain-containing protein [Clostridiales bacterium]
MITIEEYLVFPYRTHRIEYENIFMRLLDNLNVSVTSIDIDTARKAASIRAEYSYFKAMDSLQLAAACESGCDIFLTNDKQLKQFKQLECLIIDDLN